MYSKRRVGFLETLLSQKSFFSAYFGDLKLKYCPKQVQNIYEHADLMQLVKTYCLCLLSFFICKCHLGPAKVTAVHVRAVLVTLYSF